MKLRSMLTLTVLPAALGFIGAGVIAWQTGEHDIALIALGVGAATSLVLGVIVALVALCFALSVLYQSMGALFVVVQRMLVYMQGCDDDGEPDDGDPNELDPIVVYERANAPAPQPSLGFPTMPRN